MGHWPAWYRTAEPARGTCYIPAHDFPRTIARHGHHGSAWTYHKKWTTYCPNRSVSFKAVDRLAVESEAEFWEVMHNAQAAGIDPPTSYADLFSSCYRAPLPRVSVCAPFIGLRFGGWQEALRRGPARGTVYQYDLNSAYRWAATRGLPDLRTATPTWDFHDPYACYLVDQVPVGAIPYRRVPPTAVHLVTSEERDALGLQNVRGLRIRRGFSFGANCDLGPAFEKIDRVFPRALAKRIGRAFWGAWNTRNAPEVVTWKSGEKRRLMRNPFHNPIWSAFITSRVKLRMNLHRTRALHVFVDSVHVMEQLPTGDEVGDWKLVGEYRNFWCRAPGQWGDGKYTIKYTGRGSIMSAPTPLDGTPIP